MSIALATATQAAISTAIAATGANTVLWSAQPAPDGHDRTLTMGAIGAGAVPTALTVDVEISFDGGLTWQKYATAQALVTGSAAVPIRLLNFPPGPLFRLNATTVTLGGASSVTVFGTIN